MSGKLWGLIIAIGILPLTWNACSKFGTSPDAASMLLGSQDNNQQAPTSGSEAFKTGFYSFVNTQGCVQCHAANVHPTFASPDFATAYAAARGPLNGSTAPLIDFNNPDASIFIVYAGNGHCNATPCSDPNVRPTVKTLLQTWALAEGGSIAPTGPNIYATASMPIPASLPILTAGNPVVIRFDLSKLQPAVPALSGAVFEVSIQKANPTEYRLINPRLAGNTQAVTVKGIHVYVRAASGTGLGVEDQSQGAAWTGVNTQLMPSTVPATGALTGTPLSSVPLFTPTQSEPDVLTIGFDSF